MRIRFTYNALLAVFMATVVSAGFWIVIGHHSGGLQWLFWVLCSFVTSGVIDLTTRSPKP